MRFSFLGAAMLLFSASAMALDKPLDIKVTKEVKCSRPAKSGDKIKVHYRGTLESDGSEFDASYNRGQPLEFHLGKGQVIKGWDTGIDGMCVGEKRLLTIQPEYGYGARSMGPIPANSVLIFETELISIAGVPAEKQPVAEL